MKLMFTYSVRINHYRSIFNDTMDAYRAAVDFFIGVALKEWDVISQIDGAHQRKTFVEQMTHKTRNRPTVRYDFDAADRRFYKMPTDLRRAATMEALGRVSAYFSHLRNWEESPKDTCGAPPSVPKAGFACPALYRDEMYVRMDTYTARVKVYIRHTWDWLEVSLRKSDVDYILHHCADRKACVPTLRRRGKRWYLDFAFEETVTFHDTPLEDRTVLAVDLGINNPCVCTAMRSDGTILSRNFLSLNREQDCLTHSLNRIKKAQQNRAKCTPRLWAKVKGVNDDIAVKTANFIVQTAAENGCDVIVMEHLDLQGKKRGSKKQRLHHWRVQYVQRMVADKAHRLGIRVSTVCAWGTSKLAFDGSGVVTRGNYMKNGIEKTNYSMCLFPSGKEYHCDLNASYNIGARYFVREIMKSLPETVRLDMEAKVPPCAKRSTCTFSTLISLNAGLRSISAAA